MNWKMITFNPITRTIVIILSIMFVVKYVLHLNLPLLALIGFSTVLYFKRHQRVMDAFLGSVLIGGLLWIIAWKFF